MRPYVICHMVASLDGRTLPSRWAPGEVSLHGAYERLHEKLDGQAWLVGRVTGQEFAKASAYPDRPTESLPREAWFARKDADAYAVVLDAKGKIAWGRGDIGGDPIVAVLTETVCDAHLEGLRRDGVSYVFAGCEQLDLERALEELNRELGIKRLLLEGGGHVNGSFLRAGPAYGPAFRELRSLNLDGIVGDAKNSAPLSVLGQLVSIQPQDARFPAMD